MLEGVINSYGISVSYDKFLIKSGGRENLNKILKSLTIKEKPSFGKPKGSPLVIKHAYIVQKGTIIFPRIKAPIFLKHGLIDSLKQEYINEPKKIKKHELLEPLYEYQEDILNHLIEFYRNSSTFYLQMDTGLGKSRLGCALVNELQYSALIVVPTIAIGNQWIDEFNELYPDMTVGFYHNNNTVSPETHDVTIIVVNTFNKKDPSFISGYGIIIYDEAHEYHTICNSRILWLAQTRIVLGLSATPLERPDELDKYVLFHLGKPVCAKDITSKIGSVKFIGNVKCINYYGDPKFTENILTNKGTMSSILTIGNLIRDQFRIDLIIGEIKRLYNDGHGIFVFAEHRDFLDVLKSNLNGYNTSDHTSIFRGGIKDSEVQRTKQLARKNAHIVLTTYGYSRRGISLTDMTALILTTPRRNGIKQIIGRILRRGSDESIVRRIIDIVDVRCGLRNQYFDRKKIYVERGYPIETVRVEMNGEQQDDIDEEIKIEDMSQLIDEIYGP